MSSVVAAVSAATVYVSAGGTPAATAEDSRWRIALVTRDAAEREREGSAVKSIQRMYARRAVPYRETMAPAGYANKR